MMRRIRAPRLSRPNGSVHPLAPHLKTVTRAALSLAAALALAQTLWMLHPLTARAYACGDATTSTQHCYARYQFYHGSMRGSSVDIDVVPMRCGDCANYAGFVDNEMWLSDVWNQLACKIQQNPHPCWVEAGYITSTDGTAIDYFWADNRPGRGFAYHDLGPVPTGDLYTTTRFDIDQEVSDPQTFDVTISGFSGTWYAYSTHNLMQPNRVAMGQELSGTSSASAPDALFSYRDYWDADNTVQPLPALTSDETELDVAAGPPYLKAPGTDFYTYCC